MGGADSRRGGFVLGRGAAGLGGLVRADPSR